MGPSINKTNTYVWFNHAIDNWTQPTTLTDFGQVLWSPSHDKPQLGAFTGSYASSNCASVM